MDALGTVWWLVAGLVSALWSIVWFLISGWVSTIAQILVVIGVIYGFKYGWRRAPLEIAKALKSFGAFFWGWLRARDMSRPAGSVATREVIREVRVKEWGDVNVSTLLSLLVIAGVVGYVVAK